MNKVKASKMLSLILRHKPDNCDISIDPFGWASTVELLQYLKTTGIPLNISELHELVSSSKKHRFTISHDGSLIKANYGHTIPVNLDLLPSKPPDWLFHGTTSECILSIRREGIRKLKRQYVHLSEDKDAALMVGKRHGHPIALIINAAQMYKDGHAFYRPTSGTWLIDYVAIKYISFDETT